MMYGNVFLRPFETYHVTTRKFLEQVILIIVTFRFKCHKTCVLSMK